MMKPSQRYIILNSSLLFITAQIIEMTLHEFGHFFAAIFVHAQQITLHHNYTSNIGDGLSQADFILIKSAGPVVSLILGAIFHWLCSVRTRRDSLQLFSAYMSVNGYIGFFAYLIIAPFLPNSDTGYVCFALGSPVWSIWLIAIAGGTAIYFLINCLMKYFVQMGPNEILETSESRQQFIQAIILYPLAIGIIGTTLLNLPVPVWMSLIAPICGNLLFLCGYDSALKKPYSFKHASMEFDRFNRFQISLIVLFFLVVVMNRLLVDGIAFN